jgi:hypothetical protein
MTRTCCYTIAGFLLTSLLLCAVFAENAVPQDELVKPASWQIPTLPQMEQAFLGWLDQTGADAQTRADVIEHLRNSLTGDSQLEALDATLAAIQIARPEIQNMIEQSRIPRVGLARPDFSSILENPGESQFVRDHLRLLYARWLTQNDLLDEAADEFQQLDVQTCLAPAELLFYRGLVDHQLMRKESCLETMNKLMENEEHLPRRFAILARLVAADIEPLEEDSLDEITRIMMDIRRRQALYRSGRRVRTQEEEVLQKLDKLIEKIEKQRQLAQQQQQNSNQSLAPMNDSQKAAGQGSGEVAGKQQLDGGDWGSLPPAERAAAMAEMSKDLPPHYRAVIEEYFRKLAQEDK